MIATHAAGRKLHDAIFDANQACNEAIRIHGADAVTNATIGVILNEDGTLATLPTVEKTFRAMSFSELVAYAPISGLPDYLDAAIDLTFADCKPTAYFGAVATAGGTGAIHHAIANYAERGDAVLTSDWCWGTYKVICVETGKKLKTFKLFDDALNFNLTDFTRKVNTLLKKQKSLLVILNTPAHNPTGYALTNDEWDKVLDVLKAQASAGKNISLLVDIAYIDFAGEKNSTRAFMKKFGDLPENLFVMISFSMSKSFTLYGQRTGALIGVSSSKKVISEFKEVGKYSSRAAWSNVNRGAQALMINLANDKSLLSDYEAERNELYRMVKRRADVFVKEAQACGLKIVPYKGGFFIAVPAENPDAVCKKLHDDLIFAVPLKCGIRIAACSTSFEKMHGVAEKIFNATRQSGFTVLPNAGFNAPRNSDIFVVAAKDTSLNFVVPFKYDCGVAEYSNVHNDDYLMSSEKMSDVADEIILDTSRYNFNFVSKPYRDVTEYPNEHNGDYLISSEKIPDVADEIIHAAK